MLRKYYDIMNCLQYMWAERAARSGERPSRERLSEERLSELSAEPPSGRESACPVEMKERFKINTVESERDFEWMKLAANSIFSFRKRECEMRQRLRLKACIELTKKTEEHPSFLSLILSMGDKYQDVKINHRCKYLTMYLWYLKSNLKKRECVWEVCERIS